MDTEKYSKKKYDRCGKFRDNLVWVEENGLYGLINELGEEIVPPRHSRRELEVFYAKYHDERGYVYEKADEEFSKICLRNEEK